MQSIRKPLVLALALLPITLFSEGALAGGLKIFISSGHYGGHGHHYSYRTRPGFALSYGTGSHYYGRSYYSRPYSYYGHKSYSRPYGYHHYKPHYKSRGNHSYRHGYRDGYHDGSRSRHHGYKRKHCLGRHC